MKIEASEQDAVSLLSLPSLLGPFRPNPSQLHRLSRIPLRTRRHQVENIPNEAPSKVNRHPPIKANKAKRKLRILASTKPELPPAPKPRPTAEQFAEAEAELAALERKWDNYTGNNPNKYQNACAR